MNGLKLTLPATFSDSSLPIYYPDNRMNKGSLFLLDGSHPDGAWATAHGATINNIAWENAKKLIPSGTQSTLSSTVDNTNTDNTKGKIEVTGKKGLHGIISQVNDVSGSNYFLIGLPQLIKDYIFNNIARGFFISIWDRKTRLTTVASTTSDFVLLMINTADYVVSYQKNNWIPTTPILGTSHPGSVLGNRRGNIGIAQKTGSPLISSNSYYKFGSAGSYGTSELNKASSQILYMLHIMDLTSAGLTYAQADALDLAAYTAAFASTGRFYSDTFTDPATLA